MKNGKEMQNKRELEFHQHKAQAAKNLLINAHKLPPSSSLRSAAVESHFEVERLSKKKSLGFHF